MKTLLRSSIVGFILISGFFSCKARFGESSALAATLNGACSQTGATDNAEKGIEKFFNGANPVISSEEIADGVIDIEYKAADCHGYWDASLLGLVAPNADPGPRCGVQVIFSKKESLMAFALASNAFASEESSWGPLVTIANGTKVPVCGVLKK
jgi:hypothetical protein